VLLLDEPFTGLDRTVQGALASLLRTLATEGRLVIASHHDMETVRDIYDEVVLLKRHMSPSARWPRCSPRKTWTQHLRYDGCWKGGRMIDWLLEPLQHSFNQRALLAALLIG
jgi:ABC-type Mn2+/Zn2+ transport system ATPase subunit